MLCLLHDATQTSPAEFGRGPRVQSPHDGGSKSLNVGIHANATIAAFALKRLADHECLVLETLTKSQKLALWKAKYFLPEAVRTLGSLEHVKSETRASPATALEYRPHTHPGGTISIPNRTPVEEDCEPCEGETGDVCLP